ncbi:uncharacterized protein Fot_01376 [Forsythia ovata]|uniref:Uncharacterized protein n=1 Tax=Forsythia ovata TaxID=205694 RepID=A0ABD1X4C2_9LAMI
MEEESKKTYHDQEKKKMVMKIGKAGGCGGIGAVVLLGVATLAAAAIASAIIIRRKERKSGKNDHRQQEVEQSLPTELPDTLNRENDQDDASKGPITPLSVLINTCNGAADMDVIKDDSDSFLFSENLKLNEKPMLEINDGTGSPAYKEEEIFCYDNTKKLESSANIDGSVTVVYKEEFHLPTFDDKLLLEPESKNEMQSSEVEIEITKDDDTIEGVHIDKIMAENNQEMQENIEGKKNAVEMQFSEEDQTKNCRDQEIIISTCSSVAGNIVTENYGEGGQKLLLPVFDSRLIIEHENTNSDEKESSLPIESVEKTEGNKAIETAQVDDGIHKSEMQLVKQECNYPDVEIVQDYEKEISRNDDEQNAENSQCGDHVKDVQTFSLPTELPETLNKENDQANASKDGQFILPRTPPLVKKISCIGAADMDFEADSASCVFAENLELNEKPIADGPVTVIKEEFHLPTFDDKLLLEPESRNEMHKHKVETELVKEDGVHIDRIMAEDNQNMQGNIEGKQNAVEMKFSEEKTENCHDQEIVSTGSSMPGTIFSENYGDGGKELLLPVFDSRPIIQHENLNSDDKEGSLSIETVQKSERNEAIEMAQVDEGIQNTEMQLGKQEECDYPDAGILQDYEQNAENGQCEDCVKDVQTFLPILRCPSNIMPGIAIEKDSMDELLSTEAIKVDITYVADSANREMKENSSLELAVCQQKESENTEKEIEEALETIRAGIDTSEYDPIMQMSEDEEKGEDNGDDSDDLDEDDFTNTTEESSVGTGNSSTESNAECAEESLPELSIELQKPKLDNQIVAGKIQEDTSVEEEHDSQINVEKLNIIAASSETTGGELAKELKQLRLNDLKEEENTEENKGVKAEEPNFLKRVEDLNIIPDGKGNSKMTYMVELAATHNDQPAYSSRRRILIGALLALSWFSCTWYFGLSFVKLGLIVFLTMILSKIHGY